jgi:hypothetical protein
VGLDRLIFARPLLNRNLIAGTSHEDRHKYVVDSNLSIQADRDPGFTPLYRAQKKTYGAMLRKVFLVSYVAGALR